MMTAMAGQVVLITGASSGIGEALARVAAERGAKVALLARRRAKLEAITAELTAQGAKALAIECDVTSEVALQSAVAQTLESFGALDVVIANAGFGVTGSLSELSVEDYQRQFDTNVFGVLRTLYASLPALRQRAGVIGVVGSANGYVNIPGHSAYCMSKAALRALCASVRHELAAEGVSITHLAPGFVKSDFRQTDNSGDVLPTASDPIPAWLSAETLPTANLMLDAVLARKEEEIVTLHAKAVVALERHAPKLVSESMRLGRSLIDQWSKKSQPSS